MLVIVPSRKRPGNVRELISAWQDTKDRNANLLIAVDDDDPTIDEYLADAQTYPGWAQLEIGPRLRLAGTTNVYSTKYAPHHPIIGFMGDDHRPRTIGWDTQITDAMKHMGGTGVVYGNDLFQGQNLPTAVFISSDIVKTLGYFCPPGFTHMYLDNVWMYWGRGLAHLTYLPDTIIEHMHPQAGKGLSDAGYDEVNGFYGVDGEAWSNYISHDGQGAKDLAKLRGLL